MQELMELLTPEIIRELHDTNFSEATEFRDWRNHIPIELIGLWHELPIEVKASAFLVADLHAGME